MRTQIHARHFDLTQRLRDYAEKKLAKLDRYLPNITDVQLELNQERLRTEGDRTAAQLTVRNSRGTILRAEDRSQGDAFAAVDLVIDKMYRQISRYKGKRRRRAGERFATMEPELAAAELVPEELEQVEEDAVEIVRRKQIELSPMHEEEAIEQMELLGHDFFVFLNADTREVNVLYRRKEGNYGLLEPSGR